MTQDETNQQGGPAFPVSIPGCGDNGWHGMSLRDWFATHALSAVIQADGAQFFGSPDSHAEIAYQHADAMLRARNKN